MTEKIGVYLIVEFNWPGNMTTEHAKKARAFHDVVVAQDGWIREAVAAANGVGAGPSSIWVLWLESYASLDRLLKDASDPVAQAYTAFFSEMVDVRSSLREQVAFL
jgi:hypothetical protein